MVQIQHLCCCKQIYKKTCVSVFHHTRRYLKKSVINGILLQNVIITESINN